MKVMILPHVTIIGVYRSPTVLVQQLCYALNEVLSLSCSQFNIFIGDFNINWFDESNRRSLYNLFVNYNNYRQLISTYITDNQTTIDHIYTNFIYRNHKRMLMFSKLISPTTSQYVH